MNTKLEHTKLEDINLYKVGNEINLVGTIWRGREESFLAFFPDNNEDDLNNLTVLDMDLDDWKKMIRQTDLLETEILQKGPEGITKAIIRKSQRQIDGQMQWACFKDANYHCQYCYRDGIPLTLDHIDIWEDGGATILENLLTACSKCNKLRGSLYYSDWINSSTYKNRSKNISDQVRNANNNIVNSLEDLKSKRVINIRSR